MHTASKNVEGMFTHTSDGLLSRDELVLPGYTEVRVRRGTQEKIQRPAADYAPLAVYAAFDAVRAIGWLQLLTEEHIKKEKKDRVGKLPASCFEIEGKMSRRTVCVYDDGTLAALRSSVGWTYEYSDYSVLDKTQLPGTIRATENDSPIFELRMNAPQALAPGTTLQDDVTQPTLTLGWCEDMTKAMKVAEVRPQYPDRAKQMRTQGTVDLYESLGPTDTLPILCLCDQRVLIWTSRASMQSQSGSIIQQCAGVTRCHLKRLSPSIIHSQLNV